jgi:predicted permease
MCFKKQVKITLRGALIALGLASVLAIPVAYVGVVVKLFAFSYWGWGIVSLTPAAIGVFYLLGSLANSNSDQ